MSKKPLLKLNNIEAEIQDKKILNGLNLEVHLGEIHYLMGKNGAGKSTVGKVIMGHPDFEVTAGEILFEGENIVDMEAPDRSKKGIYLANQYPIEVPGVNLFNFLRLAYNARLKKGNQLSVFKFRKYIYPILELLNIEKGFLDRNLNEGFSGGEKKKCEVLQMAVLKPKFVVLDETDSGLDVDSLKDVFKGISKIKETNPNMALLVITHYNRISTFLKPDKVHILEAGKVIKSGGPEIAKDIDEKGYSK